MASQQDSMEVYAIAKEMGLDDALNRTLTDAVADIANSIVNTGPSKIRRDEIIRRSIKFVAQLKKEARSQ